MAYIGNQPSSVTNIKNEDIAADAAIAISKLDNVTASNSDLNVLNGAAAAGVTAAEVQRLAGVTSNIQDQLTAASGSATKGTLTKSFVTGETSTIALSAVSTPTASVFVTKEIPQEGVSNGDWNVNASDSGYDIQDFAYSDTVTIDVSNSTATLSSGSWSASDVGKRIVGGGGEAILIDTAGNILITNNFDDSNPVLTSGNWNFYGIRFDETGTGLTLSRGDGLSQVTFGLDRPSVVGMDSALDYDVLLGATSVSGLRFNSDGTQVTFNSTNPDKLITADLVSPYRLAGATLAYIELSYGTQMSYCHDFRFGDSGNKLYLLDNLDQIHQYDLTTPYNVSTASYTSKVFATTTESEAPTSFAINETGEILLVMDAGIDYIFQYTLSTAWDISTATYSGKSLNVSKPSFSSVTGQGWTQAYYMDATPDFSRVFISTNATYNATARGFRTLTLGSPSDIGTAKLEVPYFLNGTATNLFTVENNGSTLYYYDAQYVYTASLSTPNMLGAVYGAKSQLWDYETSSYVYSMTEDGQYIFYTTVPSVYNNTTLTWYVSKLTTPYDIQSPKLNTSTVYTRSVFTSQYAYSYATHISPDGRFVTLCWAPNGGTPQYIYQFQLNTPYTAADGITTRLSADFSTTLGNFRSIAFSKDGTRFYAQWNNILYQWNLSQAYDLQGVSVSNYAASVNVTTLSGDGYYDQMMFVKNDTFIVSADAGGHLRTFKLTDPTDISTAVQDQFSVETLTNYGAAFGGLRSHHFSDEGTRLKVLTTNSRLYDIPLPGSYQLDSVFSQLHASTANTVSIAINADETKSYHLDAGLITEYTLGAKPKVFNGATATGNTFAANTHETTPQGITFSTDGTKLFVIGGTSNTVLRYDVLTAFDLGTVTTTGYQSFNVTSEDTDCIGVRFNAAGTKMFVVGNQTKKVHQYSLSSPFDLDTATYDSVFIDLSVMPVYTDYGILDVALNAAESRMYVLCNGVYDYIAEFRLPNEGSINDAAFTNLVLALPYNNSQSFAVNSSGTRWYLGTNTDAYVLQGEYNSVSVSIVPLDQYLSAITNSVNRIDTQYWTDINSMSPVGDTLNNGFVYYAISSDAQDTFKIADNSNGIRSIVRNNAGTWQYNSSLTYETESWTNAAVNNKFDALGEALAVSTNRMTGSTLAGVSDNNHFPVEDNLDLAIILFQEEAGTPAKSDGVRINYNAQALNKGAILGTDYDYDVPSSTSVRITSLKDQNLKIKVV